MPSCSAPHDSLLAEQGYEVETSDLANDPLYHRQMPFSAGLHRKAVTFVPASKNDGHLASSSSNTGHLKQKRSVADLYLRIVLPKEYPPTSDDNSPTDENSHPEDHAASRSLCSVCHLPLDDLPGSTAQATPQLCPNAHVRPCLHAGSLAHQLSLPHSRPPSSIDRTRMGHKVLSTQGWDPDADSTAHGLGAQRQGMAFPLKLRAKYDKLGLGVGTQSEDGGGGATIRGGKFMERKGLRTKEPVMVQKSLDAGRVREMFAEERRKADRLRRQLFGRQDMEKYLGPGAVDF